MPKEDLSEQDFHLPGQSFLAPAQRTSSQNLVPFSKITTASLDQTRLTTHKKSASSVSKLNIGNSFANYLNTRNYKKLFATLLLHVGKNIVWGVVIGIVCIVAASILTPFRLRFKPLESKRDAPVAYLVGYWLLLLITSALQSTSVSVSYLLIFGKQILKKLFICVNVVLICTSFIIVWFMLGVVYGTSVESPSCAENTWASISVYVSALPTYGSLLLCSFAAAYHWGKKTLFFLLAGPFILLSFFLILNDQLILPAYFQYSTIFQFFTRVVLYPLVESFFVTLALFCGRRITNVEFSLTNPVSKQHTHLLYPRRVGMVIAISYGTAFWSRFYSANMSTTLILFGTTVTSHVLDLIVHCILWNRYRLRPKLQDFFDTYMPHFSRAFPTFFFRTHYTSIFYAHYRNNMHAFEIGAIFHVTFNKLMYEYLIRDDADTDQVLKAIYAFIIMLALELVIDTISTILEALHDIPVFDTEAVDWMHIGCVLFICVSVVCALNERTMIGLSLMNDDDVEEVPLNCTGWNFS